MSKLNRNHTSIWDIITPGDPEAPKAYGLRYLDGGDKNPTTMRRGKSGKTRYLRAQLRGSLRPWAKLKKRFTDIGRPYVTQTNQSHKLPYQFKQDFWQPLYGLKNIGKGAIGLLVSTMAMALYILLFLLTFGLFDGIELFYPMTWIVESCGDLVKGILEVGLFPLTWLIKIPVRIGLTVQLPSLPYAEDKPEIKRLVKKARNDLTQFRQALPQRGSLSGTQLFVFSDQSKYQEFNKRYPPKNHYQPLNIYKDLTKDLNTEMYHESPRNQSQSHTAQYNQLLKKNLNTMKVGAFYPDDRIEEILEDQAYEQEGKLRRPAESWRIWGARAFFLVRGASSSCNLYVEIIDIHGQAIQERCPAEITEIPGLSQVLQKKPNNYHAIWKTLRKEAKTRGEEEWGLCDPECRNRLIQDKYFCLLWEIQRKCKKSERRGWRFKQDNKFNEMKDAFFKVKSIYQDNHRRQKLYQNISAEEVRDIETYLNMFPQYSG